MFVDVCENASSTRISLFNLKTVDLVNDFFIVPQ